MRAGYIIVKTRQGMEMCRLAKDVDALCARLEHAAVYRPDLGLESVNQEVFEFCEEVERSLSQAADQFKLLPGAENAELYRQVIRDSRFGKQRRLKMKTLTGEKLFRLTLSVDRMCVVIGMLHRRQLVTPQQGREFFEAVAGILRDTSGMRNSLGKILRNAESVLTF